MKLDELIERGVTRVRLPAWNERAFLEVSADSIWAELFDVGTGVGSGVPLQVLVAVCAQHADWEAA